ncbi:MAG TPA: BMP family ABC transporter substrate-binding protein [Anaerolineae bacterium]|nr:BMP family ABC transporter substrate-binding protein [Anaerolineae bacterium]
MRKYWYHIVVSLVLPLFLLSACGGQAGPERVCVVLDREGETDKGFNEFSLKGAREAAERNGLAFQHVITPGDNQYKRMIDNFVEDGCDLIITVSFLMGDATAEAAREYPDVHFAIVDLDYGSGYGCDENVDSCYTEEGGLTNVTSLMFAEDEVGFLAGALAACMSETDVIGVVGGMAIPPVVRFVDGYTAGARHYNENVTVLSTYLDTFEDTTRGKLEGEAMLDEGADVLFAAAGLAGNGTLLAAHEQGAMAIGVDVDQYLTFPEVGSSLLTSASKKVDVATGDAVDAFAAGELESGIRLSTLKNEGVGLTPYHEFEDQVMDICDSAVKTARTGIITGRLSTAP